MKLAIILFFSIFTFFSSAQNKVPTLEEAKKFIIKSTTVQELILEPEDENYYTFSDKEIGDIIIEGNHIYKIEKTYKTLSINFGSIRLDATKHSQKEIDMLKETILAKYKFGVPFSKLVELYSDDKGEDYNRNIPLNSWGENPETNFENQGIVGEISVVASLSSNSDLHILVQNSAPELTKFIIVQHVVYE